MMKTKKEIQFHLNNTAYNKVGAHKIVAFLLGKDILRKGESLNFKEIKKGEPIHTFDHFYRWFACVDSKKVLDSLFEDLGEKRALAIENEKWDVADRTQIQIEFLVDAFGLNNKERDNKSE